MTRKRPLFYALYLFVLVVSCFLLAMEGTEAATYNFYFNNTEQGANSTATPSLVVQDGKQISPTSTATSTDTNTGTATDGLPTGEPAVEPTEPTQEATAPSGGSLVRDIPAMERTFPDAKWKFSLGTIRADYSRDSGRSRTSQPWSGIGSLTYYASREFGFSFHVGRFLGPEVEYNPFAVRTGWGKVQFGVVAGLLKDVRGFARMDRLKGEWFRSSSATSHPLNIYFGGQVGFNVIRDVSVNFAYRFAPIERYNNTTSSVHWSANYLF